jgi:hypothetical protein
MPRKNSAQLKDGPVTLSEETEKHLAKLAQCVRHPATEEHFQVALASSRALEEQWVRVNVIQCEKSSDPNWPAFQEAMQKLGKLQAAEISAYHTWRRYEELAKEADARSADPTQSNVEFSSLHMLVKEEFEETGAELQWNVKTAGLVSYMLAESISGFLVRDESQEPPLCEACSE